MLNSYPNGTTVEIFNTLGQKIVSKTLNNNTSRAVYLAPGVYTVTLSHYGKKMTQKIIMH